MNSLSCFILYQDPHDRVVLSEQAEAKLGYSAFIFTVINNYTLYFLNIVLVGMTLTSIMSEYQNEALQVDPDT